MFKKLFALAATAAVTAAGVKVVKDIIAADEEENNVIDLDKCQCEAKEEKTCCCQEEETCCCQKEEECCCQEEQCCCSSEEACCCNQESTEE